MVPVSRKWESAVARSFVASAILARYDFYSTLTTFEVKFIQFYACTLSTLTWHLLIRRANQPLVEVGDMPIPTSYAKNMARLTRRWLRRNFLRFSIEHFLRLLAHTHHQIIPCQVLQDSQHSLAMLTLLQHFSGLVDSRLTFTNKLMCSLLREFDERIGTAWLRKILRKLAHYIYTGNLASNDRIHDQCRRKTSAINHYRYDQLF